MLRLMGLTLAKYLGLFIAARRLTRRRVRILCYHGFNLGDESDFRPKLFIRTETFERRMRYLATHGYRIISLDDACAGLAAGRHPDHAVVITVDDGFYSVYRSALRVLKQHAFPATAYISTYYVANANPIFRLSVQYIFWKTRAAALDVSALGLPLEGVVPIGTPSQKHALTWEIIRFAEAEMTEDARCRLASQLGERLGVDYARINESRCFSLMTPDEIRELAGEGVDVQLHTHRHRLPDDAAGVEREIVQNRQVLEPLVGRRLVHFCYPSGAWSTSHWPALESVGIVSATTCLPGLNGPQTPRLRLQRFLDGEQIAAITFEAEVSGFGDVARTAREWVRRLGSGLRRRLLLLRSGPALLGDGQPVRDEMGRLRRALVPSRAGRQVIEAARDGVRQSRRCRPTQLGAGTEAMGHEKK